MVSARWLYWTLMLHRGLDRMLMLKVVWTWRTVCPVCASYLVLVASAAAPVTKPDAVRGWMTEHRLFMLHGFTVSN